MRAVRVPWVSPLCGSSRPQGEKINRCAPGGEAVMLKIAALLNVDPQPVDGDAQEAEPARMLAVIDEPNCIGCIAYPGLSGGCHRWGDPRHAYRDERPVHRLQFVRRPPARPSAFHSFRWPPPRRPGNGICIRSRCEIFLWNNMFKLIFRFPKRQGLGFQRRYSPA